MPGDRPVHALMFVDAERVAMGGFNGELSLWNARTGKKVRDLNWHIDEIAELAVSPDGKTLASVDVRGWIRLWDLGGY